MASAICVSPVISMDRPSSRLTLQCSSIGSGILGPIVIVPSELTYSVDLKGATRLVPPVSTVYRLDSKTLAISLWEQICQNF